MKTEYGVALIVAALIIGVLAGYGIWGLKATQVAELDGKIQQLTQENADLKSRLPAPAAAAAEGAAPVAALASGQASGTSQAAAVTPEKR
jgi:ABC-type lipoprotein release transport system permease subunit